MALKKEEINSGEVRYYEGIASVSEVAEVYTAEEITSLTSLSIRDAKLKSSAGIKVFENLEELVLGNNKLTEAAELEHLQKLRDLDLSENKLKAVSGLAGTPLKFLNLSENPIASLSDIDAPASVVRFNLNGCRLRDLEGLARFSQLKTLQLYGNQIASIEFDGAVPSLETLKLKDNPLQRTAGLAAFPGVKELSIGDDIRILEGLENLPDLKKIEITGPLEEITPESLEVLIALKKGAGKVNIYQADGLYDRYPELKLPPKKDASGGSLNYRSEPLTVSGLASLYESAALEGVTYLNLTGCDVTDTAGLDAFPALTTLDLTRNRVSRVVGLGVMSSLDTLTLAENAIVTVSDIEPSTSLDEMSLESNQLESLNGLSSFTNLRKLNVTRNPTLKDANPGQPLESLQELLLSKTGLDTMEGMSAAFPNLRKLELEDTGVTSIVGLDGFEHLEYVEMSDKVDTIDPGSLAKIVAMRAEGKRARFGWSDPDALLAKYPALAAT